MPDIVSFGEPMVEFNAEAVGGPRSGSVFTVGYGGDSSNFAVAASRLGARSGYLTRVGADPFGAMLQGLWHDERVDGSHVIVDERHPTGLYFILRHGAMSEFVYRRTGSAASHLSADDIPHGWIESARILHVTGITQAISTSAREAVFAGIERARAAGVTVTYDPNIRPALWSLHAARATARYTIPLCDVVLPNLEEGRMLTGKEDPRAITRELLAIGAKMIVLKMGGSGAVVATQDDYIPVPTRAVLAKDATGAGDTFDAGFAVALLEGRAPREAAIFAAAAASRVVEGLGAVGPIPRRHEVDGLVEELLAAL
ncbi:sugar kinase [Microbacterium sp. Marseille-Q6965]|uniref:sugar kinase n=1 Tax=Microbacterium sp. Marseille-Q6965 TaxID=2965072 RepID=UPI0021B7AEEA|nr:sugar kinase [Microbacterium sp. Marseille-Q6965]